VRLGLAYVKGAATAEMEGLVAERERGGSFAGLGDLAARGEVRRGTLEQLAWAGACDGLPGGRERRSTLWQIGMAAAAEKLGDGSHGEAGEGTQLALAFELPAAPRLRALGRWQRLIADYSTSGVTIGDHAMAILRERLTVPKLVTSAQLARLPSGCEVAVAGLVIARQRPGTAKGTMFLLFEDEFGTINLIVAKQVYERHRQLARAEPLLLARGRLERSLENPPAEILRLDSRARAQGVAGGHDSRVQGQPGAQEPIRPVINVIVRELCALEDFLPDGAEGEPAAARASVHRLPGSVAEAAREEEIGGAEVGSSIRAAAPPVQSFAMGRRR
jgi:error-prone DNA polymerase